MWPYTRSIDARGEDKAALRGDAETARLALEGGTGRVAIFVANFKLWFV